MHATPPLTNVFGFVVAFLYFLLIWIDIGVSACFVFVLFFRLPVMKSFDCKIGI